MTRSARQQYAHIGDVVATTFKDVKSYFNGLMHTNGIASGFSCLDTLTGGFRASELIVLGGRPSIGKTALSLCITKNLAMCSKIPTLYVTLESSTEFLVSRLLLILADIDCNKLRMKRLTDEDWLKIEDAKSMLLEAPLFICYLTYPSLRTLIETANQILTTVPSVAMVVVDSIQKIEETANPTLQLNSNEVIPELKNLTVRQNVTVFATSNLVSAVDERIDKRPMPFDLATGAQQLENIDTILMLYRDEYYDPDSPGRGTAELMICKQRNGPTGCIELTYHAKSGSFEDRQY